MERIYSLQYKCKTTLLTAKKAAESEENIALKMLLVMAAERIASNQDQLKHSLEEEWRNGYKVGKIDRQSDYLEG
jgi:hypothetical protein